MKTAQKGGFFIGVFIKKEQERPIIKAFSAACGVCAARLHQISI
jgi:hypothetical protein